MSWLKFNKDIVQLANTLKKHRFSAILALPRGGLVPAVCLSHLLGIPLITRVSTQNSGIILVLDELVDSGNQMLKLTQKLNRKGAQYKTAVLYRKDCTKCEPNFYVETINSWIVLPWEYLPTKEKQNGVRKG